MNINVIEAQKLVGVNINPAVYITVGDEKKHTVTQKSTNCPFFNEVHDFQGLKCRALAIGKFLLRPLFIFMLLFVFQNFMFEFQETQDVLFDKVIQIAVSGLQCKAIHWNQVLLK